jgi:hypothetical protein
MPRRHGKSLAIPCASMLVQTSHTQLTLTRTTLSRPHFQRNHRFERTPRNVSIKYQESARATPVDHANASGAVTPRCGRELRTHARLVQTPKGNQLVQRPSLKLTMCSSKADHRRAQQRTSGKGACKTNGSCFLASRRHFALRSGNHKISTHTFHKRNHHARGQAVHLKRAPHNVG